MSQRYQVILVNQYDPGVDVETIKKAFARRFKLSMAATNRLFAQESVVVKKDLDAEMAADYKMAIDATGAHGRIEPMPNTPVFQERRKRTVDRRQQQNRRKYPRENSIMPDRRLNKDRRRQD